MENIVVFGGGLHANVCIDILEKEVNFKIVGIIDRVGGLINEEGFSFEEIRSLFLNKNGNELDHPNMLSFNEVSEKIWDVKADVFIPCAASRLVTQNQLDIIILFGEVH